MADDYRLLAPGDLVANRYGVEALYAMGSRSALVSASQQLGSSKRWVIVQVFYRRDAQEMTRIHERIGTLAAATDGPSWRRPIDFGVLENGHAYAVFAYEDGTDYTPLLTG